MRRLCKLFGASLLVAACVVALLTVPGFAAAPVRPSVQDPAPAQGPAAKPVTVGDLVQALSAARADQAAAQADRDARAQALADADAALKAKADAAASADQVLDKAVAKLGPVLIDGVVYEPTADGGVRSFRPASADTPVPADN